MSNDNLISIALAIGGILFGIYNQYKHHELKKVVKENSTFSFGIRVTVDKSGKSDPVITVYKAPDEINVLGK